MLLTAARSADLDLAQQALRHRPTVAAIVAVEVCMVAAFWGEPVLAALLVLGVLGPVLARIDVVERRLPFTLTVPLFAAVLLLVGSAALSGGAPMARAAVSAAVWVVFYCALHVGTHGRGMGLGDVVLAPTLGLVLGWIGWGASMVGLAAGFVVAAFAAALLCAVGRGSRSSMPFGPFMLAGAWLGAVSGPAIWIVYLAGGD
ncbi:MAG: prepilin peptidase [Sporichthyaceae bacterium]